jgi:hypothetical protein
MQSALFALSPGGPAVRAAPLQIDTLIGDSMKSARDKANTPGVGNGDGRVLDGGLLHACC